MVGFRSLPLTIALASALTMTFALAAGTVVTAQDPAGQPGNPAYLQGGTCAEPGAVIAALAVIGRGGGDAAAAPAGRTPEATGTPDPLTAAVPASVSVTEIETSLDDLLSAPLIVRIAESAEAPDRDAACGVVAGGPDADGNVYVALSERNGSDLTGIAWLQEDGSRMTVTLFVIPTVLEPTPGAAE